jgi:tRNA (guanine10-N2)-dimethyltransferase
LFVRHGRQTYVAQTVAIQDIDAYAARDQKRPKRDARVGMLPPKLAQIIINLATGFNLASPGRAILDPFCGTGVILQEALLMGYDAYGTDLEDRMIDFSEANLDWLGKQCDLTTRTYLLETGDATNFEWQNFDTIACETYLGRPFSALPAPDVLSKVMQDVDTIHRRFLQNVYLQTKPGFRMCIAVPAWKTAYGFKHLKVLDSLEELGYTRTVFSHAEAKDLVYHRPEQIVARELVVLTRN